MKKITTNTKIELTKEDVKFINDIGNFWIALDEEFGEGITCEEFADFLSDVIRERNYTVLNNEYIEIVRK